MSWGAYSSVQPPSHGATLLPLVLQSVYTAKVAPSQMQNLVLALVKLHEVGDCSLICLDLSAWPLQPWRSQQLLPA